MMKVKYFVLCILGCLLAFISAYYISENSLLLLWTDVTTGFVYNREGLLVAIIGSICYWVAIYFVYKSRIVLCWEIRIGRWSVELSNLREKKLFVNALLGTLAIIFTLICGIVVIRENEFKIDDSWSRYTIAHAMGSVDGNDYTNSFEAFKLNYEKGQRVFEVDFELTSDNKVVCKHEWTDWNEWTEIPTEAEYLNSKVKGKYTPLSLEECLGLLDEYRDIWLVTDSKYIESEQIEKEFQAIMNVVDEQSMLHILDRLIVQVYDENMYYQIKDIYDFQHVIFTMYKLEWEGETDEFERYCRFFKGNGIKYVTMSTGNVSEELIDIADQYGLRVFVHTVNDIEEARGFLEQGIQGIYTDEILMEELREE